MKKTLLDRFYSLQAPIYDFTRKTFLFGYQEAVNLLNLTDTSELLDIACGTGKSIEKAIVHTKHITGIDYSHALLSVAKHKFPTLQFLHGDVSSYDYGKKYDAMISSYSLTMIDAWQETIKHSALFLKDDGVFIILDFGATWSKYKRLEKIIHIRLGRCGVDNEKDFEKECRKYFSSVTVHKKISGYYQIIVCRK